MANEPKKLTVNLSPQVHAELQDMARQRGTTMTEVLRHAIGMEKLVTEAKNKNQKILIEDTDGKMQRIVIP